MAQAEWALTDTFAAEGMLLTSAHRRQDDDPVLSPGVLHGRELPGLIPGWEDVTDGQRVSIFLIGAAGRYRDIRAPAEHPNLPFGFE
ncbi:hypothetical protein GCM10023196_082090 [Actinoallomurus vinaceus]|uniref:Uncharacterized protein n=1 Tax=Actinoallomurus vinaceus TaxID=1080074 RepID=A0ABP8UQH3_9ACTN